MTRGPLERNSVVESRRTLSPVLCGASFWTSRTRMRCIDEAAPGEFNAVGSSSMDIDDYGSIGPELHRRKSSN
jgi:hypothetical protein